MVQEELAATFQAELEALQSRLHALQAEIEQSQHAFDTYRERAKQSLLKSAAEQKASEVALAAANEQLQVRYTCLFVFNCGILMCLCIFGCTFRRWSRKRAHCRSRSLHSKRNKMQIAPPQPRSSVGFLRSSLCSRESWTCVDRTWPLPMWQRRKDSSKTRRASKALQWSEQNHMYILHIFCCCSPIHAIFDFIFRRKGKLVTGAPKSQSSKPSWRTRQLVRSSWLGRSKRKATRPGRLFWPRTRSSTRCARSCALRWKPQRR